MKLIIQINYFCLFYRKRRCWDAAEDLCLWIAFNIGESCIRISARNKKTNEIRTILARRKNETSSVDGSAGNVSMTKLPNTMLQTSRITSFLSDNLFLTLFELLPKIVSVIDSWIAQMIIYPSHGNNKIIESLSSPLYISYKKCPSITIMNIYIKCVYKICTIWKTKMVVVSYQIL